MKVSILMCAYNAEAYVAKAIRSVLDQTYQNWELLISNDHSQDATREQIAQFLADNRIMLFDQDTNLGIIRNKNWLFAKASGDLITQLDADDLYSPDKVERQVAVFMKYPDINICATNTSFIDIKDNLINVHHHEKDLIITEMSVDYPFMFAGLMIRALILKEAGSFSEYFIGVPGDDNYWTLRLNHKYPIYFIKDPLYSYRIHPASFTNTLAANPRKLIASDILDELYRQRKETGTDYLESGQWEKMQAFERAVLSNPSIMGEKYRIAGAKEVDKQNLGLARQLLQKSFRLNKFNPDLYRTMLYYLRSRLQTPAGQEV